MPNCRKYLKKRSSIKKIKRRVSANHKDKTSPVNSKNAKKLMKKKIAFKHNTVKFLWTDWNKNVQLFAQLVANELNKINGESAYTLEQTNFVRQFLKNCGDWENEAKYMSMIKRKQIWDSFSIKFAKHYTEYTVICVPAIRNKSIKDKTLVAIELPILNTDKYCVLSYNHKTHGIFVNPHLDTKKRCKCEKITLDFKPYTKNALNKILNWL